jgi:FtsP/CotA-like multicopper oxidase with cupredoxin domain
MPMLSRCLQPARLALAAKLRNVVPIATSRRETPRRTLPTLGAFGLSLALVALGAYIAVRPTAGQEGYPELSEFVSKDGVVQVQLTAEEKQIELAGTPVAARVYNGEFVGPTMRLGPGDTIELQLVNSLPEPTNLHFHGLHVSPSGESDNILRHVAAGETAQYVVDLPADHAPGTFWYHSHQHGISEEQVFGGMSGLIVVDGLIDLLPEELRNIAERSVALKDFQLTADGEIVRDNIDSNAPTTRTVNGTVNPQLSIAPGETQLWRLANIGADIWYELSLEGHEFYVVAEDGNPVWNAWFADSLILAPGKRYDVLVQGQSPGSYIFRTLDFDQGGDHYPDTTLATLDVTGDAVTPATLPASLVPQDDPVHGDLSSATVDNERTLVFTEDDDQNIFMIDGKQFDPNRVDQEVKLGTIEDWTIRNDTEELHPFHIHVNDFQVISINGEPYEASGLQDTVPLPINGEVVVRIPFRDFTGKFVYHCHILNHEDNGMMGIVEVVP